MWNGLILHSEVVLIKSEMILFNLLSGSNLHKGFTYFICSSSYPKIIFIDPIFFSWVISKSSLIISLIVTSVATQPPAPLHAHVPALK